MFLIDVMRALPIRKHQLNPTVADKRALFNKSVSSGVQPESADLRAGVDPARNAHFFEWCERLLTF